MPNTKVTLPIVQKEDIRFLKFNINNDVLEEEHQKKERTQKIQKALKLGNGNKFKVKIIFEDKEGKKIVETTIWGVTEKNIILKQGVLIPIKSIYNIKFY